MIKSTFEIIMAYFHPIGILSTGIFSITVDQSKLRFFETSIFVDIMFLMVILSAMDFLIFLIEVDLVKQNF